MAIGMDSVEGKRILVVDDNDTNLKILETQLKLWKYQVILASSGKQALELYDESGPFDLVLTDMQMPEMDGVDLARKLKLKKLDLPIIVLSSLGDSTYGSQAGVFSAILTKPVKQHKLFQEILGQLKNPVLSKRLIEETEKKMPTDFARKNPAKILVAEDNLINQVVIRKTLDRLGYSAQVVVNGCQVMEVLESGNFDIVLMDVQMPEMDGLEATRQIRLKYGKHPFIIAMTANAMQTDREECLAAGMDDYISKPIMLDDLMKKLELWAANLVDA
jgi:CheY-like chemotaxis protein